MRFPVRDHRCLRSVALLIALATWSSVSAASWALAAESSWSFFRGPHYDGHSDEDHIAESWPANGPPVLWVREAGKGYSSFVAWDNRVATQWQTVSGQYVVCLDADTGETIWQYRYDWPYLPASVYPGPRATPTYDQGHLYFAAPNGLIGCLRADKGSLLWSINVKDEFQGQGTDFGYACSPLVVDGKVILPVGGQGASMVALDALSGSVLWRSGDDPASYASALPITYRGHSQVIGYLQNALVCHDLQTGELLWRHALSHGYDEHSSWPIYREPYLWIASAFRGGSELLELTGDNSTPPRLVWRSDLLSNDILSSVLADDALFGFDVRDAQAKSHRPTRGSFRCINLLDGQPLWANDAENPYRPNATGGEDLPARVGHASVIVADGKLILLNDTGDLILARATKTHYEELARTVILGGEICWTQPALDRGRIYARNQSRAICVYIGKPELLDPRMLDAAIPAEDVPQPIYRDFATWLLGVEPEFAFDIPSHKWLIEWFFVAWPGILGISWLLATLTRGCGPLRSSRETSQRVFWSTAFVLGVAGTTLLSRWRNDFVFTWHVAIFVAFQAAVYQLPFVNKPPMSRAAAWRSRLVGLFFIGSCLAYFLICRRLSLVFEWVFLCGFAAAIPFCVAGAACFRKRSGYWAWEGLMTSLAFAAFYWSSVAVLVWKAR